MTKVKLVGNRIREEKYENGKVREILETKLVDKERKPCKQCKTEPRAPVSSRCVKCSQEHIRQNMADTKLHTKIQLEMERRQNN